MAASRQQPSLTAVSPLHCYADMRKQMEKGSNLQSQVTSLRQSRMEMRSSDARSHDLVAQGQNGLKMRGGGLLAKLASFLTLTNFRGSPIYHFLFPGWWFSASRREVSCMLSTTA